MGSVKHTKAVNNLGLKAFANYCFCYRPPAELKEFTNSINVDKHHSPDKNKGDRFFWHNENAFKSEDFFPWFSFMPHRILHSFFRYFVPFWRLQDLRNRFLSVQLLHCTFCTFSRLESFISFFQTQFKL